MPQCCPVFPSDLSSERGEGRAPATKPPPSSGVIGVVLSSGSIGEESSGPWRSSSRLPPPPWPWLASGLPVGGGMVLSVLQPRPSRRSARGEATDGAVAVSLRCAEPAACSTLVDDMKAQDKVTQKGARMRKCLVVVVLDDI